MRRKVLFILAAVVLLGVAAWAIWGLSSSLQDHAEQDEIFQRLRKIATEDNPTDLGPGFRGEGISAASEPSQAVESEEESELIPMPEAASTSHDIQALQEENPECVAWISIEGTDIDYPVMWSPDDPDYYLDHSFEKTSNRHGVPFLDYRFNINTADNLIIYGHHFVEGEMFSALHKYGNYSFYEDHPVITLETAEEISQYRIAAVLRVSGTVYPTMGIPTIPITPCVPLTERKSHFAFGSVFVVAPACLLFFSTHLATPSSSEPNSDRICCSSDGSTRNANSVSLRA